MQRVRLAVVAKQKMSQVTSKAKGFFGPNGGGWVWHCQRCQRITVRACVWCVCVCVCVFVCVRARARACATYYFCVLCVLLKLLHTLLDCLLNVTFDESFLSLTSQKVIFCKPTDKIVLYVYDDKTQRATIRTVWKTHRLCSDSIWGAYRFNDLTLGQYGQGKTEVGGGGDGAFPRVRRFGESCLFFFRERD